MAKTIAGTYEHGAGRSIGGSCHGEPNPRAQTDCRRVWPREFFAYIGIALGLIGAFLWCNTLIAHYGHDNGSGIDAICKTDGFNVTVVVVDRSGATILLLRSDTANPHNPELARRKAYTALTFRQASRDWALMIISNPVVAAQRDLKDVIALGGGVPVMWGDEPIGAIGVSGATIVNEDDRCAHAGVAAVASLLSLKGAQK